MVPVDGHQPGRPGFDSSSPFFSENGQHWRGEYSHVILYSAEPLCFQFDVLHAVLTASHSSTGMSHAVFCLLTVQ
jgi:hypothetical protein